LCETVARDINYNGLTGADVVLLLLTFIIVVRRRWLHFGRSTARCRTNSLSRTLCLGPRVQRWWQDYHHERIQRSGTARY